MTYNHAIGWVLGLGALAFVLILGGVGSDALTDDPPAINPYTVEPTGGEPSEPQFVISTVAFGDGGYVEISNIGGADGELDSYWLCKRPSYFQLSGLLAAGATARFEAASSGFGTLRADSGEFGLYDSGSFGDSGSIVAYVEWGDSGHGRSSTAVAAGVWPDGEFVDAAGAAMIVATENAPTSAGGWGTG